jgi:hypothetical protein
MILALEVVGHIPELGARLTWNILAALHVTGLRGHRFTVAPRLGANCPTCDGSTDSSQIFAGATTHLMPEHATDQRTHNGSWYVGAALFLRDLFALHPAALFGCPDNGAH